jgi:hypothetical protein
MNDGNVYQKETHDKIYKFITDIKVDLIKNISLKYKLDEKLIIRDFINNEWSDEEGEKQDENTNTNIDKEAIKKDKEQLTHNELCRAKKNGNIRCTRRCQLNKKYCGTHLKQIEVNGNLKYGYINSDDSDNEKDNNKSKKINDIETVVSEASSSTTHIKNEEDAKYVSHKTKNRIKADHIKFQNGIEILLCSEDNTVYDKINGEYKLVGELVEENDTVKILYNDYFISNFININNNLFDGDNKHVGVLNNDNSISYTKEYLHYLKGSYNF